MPSFAEQQAQVVALIQSQIEESESAIQTLPYWEAYNAVVRAREEGNSPAPTVLQKDARMITGNVQIPEGFAYVYMKVVSGPVTIDGLTYEANEYLNLEPIANARHAAISIQATGGSVRLVGEY